jgi:hypothetical protein
MSTPLFSFAFMAPELSALDWARLEKRSELSFTQVQRTQLVTSLTRYYDYILDPQGFSG